MKIATLLAHYLYANKKLDLPGLGTFLLETGGYTEPDAKNKQVLLEGASFQYNVQTKEDPELIAFISLHTGKIKPLASSDLDSHLELAKQFMNIGKPFLFEGIGTLAKVNRNEYSFSPGAMITEPLQEHGSHEPHHVTIETPADYKEVFYTKKQPPAWKKPLTFSLVIAGIALAIWGGYTVYKNSSSSGGKNDETNAAVEKNNTNAVLPDTTASLQDTTQTAKQVNDTAATTLQPVTQAPAGSYKFVVETAEKERALNRYEKLKNSFKLPVQMETKDSVTFKIYFTLAANPADTARMIDSLRKAYTPPGKKAFVE